MPGTMSTKLDMMLRLLDDFDNQSKGDKTIVFSQFTSFLDLVEDALRVRGYNFTRYDGSMRRNAREEALQRIRTDDGVRVILISFKAGSTGLNLTCCNRVILCDLWWNPQIEEQAFDRAHRLGQTKSVYIYKLSIDGTVEQRILALQVRAQAKSFFDTHAGQKAPACEGRLGWTFVRMRVDSHHRLPQRMLAEQLTKQNGASWILWTCSFCFTAGPSSLHNKQYYESTPIEPKIRPICMYNYTMAPGCGTKGSLMQSQFHISTYSLVVNSVPLPPLCTIPRGVFQCLEYE